MSFKKKKTQASADWTAHGDAKLAKPLKEYLRPRGISPSYWPVAEYLSLTPDLTRELTRVDAITHGLLIPYMDLDGEPMISNGQPHVRVRLVGLNTEPKFKQPYDTPNRLYYAPVHRKYGTWSDIADDTDTTIYIVEGEIKAAALAQHGRWVIGIGGAWNWVTRKADEGSNDSIPCPDFNLIKWQGRKVVLAFDHDVLVNPKLRLSIARLSRFLCKG